ncbi:MAG TPA: FKBP-type peptidyl-prolyl cis-trans isomerase, partial [Rhodocyclaceae bacterium]|nr:FKBP-type peptidyl-prolyl cis-trans isomerase [Rhodocyclaceae bacterium]
MSETVRPDSLVTLRYRLSCEGRELVSTMDGRPSTFQLGTGELAPPLERCLLGMAPASQASFELEPDAFGAHNASLVRQVARSEFPADAKLEIGEAVTLAIQPGQQASGLIRAVADDAVTVDLNHPLAGKPLRFE